MNGAFYIAATGLRAQQNALDVSANNIANINTAGFKRVRAQFSELVGANAQPAQSVRGLDQPSGSTPAGLSGVMVGEGTRVFTQGDIKETGASMDLAIRGDGFMELMGPGGETLLWRGGTLRLTDEGLLAASNGMPLRAMISAPAGARDLTVAADGRVSALLSGDTAPTELGRIDLALVDNPGLLTARGEGLYASPDNAQVLVVAPGADGAGDLAQGAVETSNVQLSEEMVGLLLTQRAYAANAQLLQVGDQFMAIANGLKR